MTNLNPKPTAEERLKVQAKNAHRVLLISTITLAMATILAVVATIVLREYNFLGAYVMGTLTLVSLTSLILNRRGGVFVGVYLLIGIMLAGLALPFLVNGTGISVGLVVILMVTGLAPYAVSPERTGRFIVAATVAGALSTLLDMYTPVYLTKSNPTATLIFTFALLIAYLILIVRRYRAFPVRTKLVITAVVIALLPLAVLSISNNVTINRRLEGDARASLATSAKQAATSIDTLINSQMDIVRAEARLPQIVDFLQSPQTLRTSEDASAILETLTALKRRDPIYISSYALLDNNGQVVADTDELELGANKSDREYFIRARDTKLPFVSGVRYSPSTNDASIYISAPVSSPDGQFLGVLRVRYDADIIQYLLVNQAQAETGSTTGLYRAVVDSTYFFIIADTEDPNRIGNSYYPFENNQLPYLQTIDVVPDGVMAPPTTNQPELVEALQNMDMTSIFIIGAGAAPEEGEIYGAARTENNDWIVVAAEPMSLITNPVSNQTRATTTLAIAAAFLAALAAWFGSQPISGPIVRLTDTARAVSAGNLSARAAVETEDEIGALATAFNQMTGQLSETLVGLEERVRTRTSELEKTSRQNLERAESLAAISEVSRAIAAEQDLEKLLPLITRVVSERFNFYHVGIFLIDDQRQYALLRAANSEGGQRMLARGHRLKVGQEGIVGNVTAIGRPRIALDVGADATFFNNPDLPLTRSEMALPLVLRGQVIGALDVQSITSQAFTDEDAETLSVLAAQVATAIDNANLFGETRAALAEAQALYSEYQSQAWQNVIRRQGATGFKHGPSGAQTLSEPVQRNEITQAVTAGEVIVTQPGQGVHPALAAPIKLREKVIGVLDIRAQQSDHRWSAEEIDLVRSVAARVALALENARLLEETRQRANRERLVAEITTRIRSSNDPQAMMQTAVEELKTALGVSRVEIVPQTAGGNEGAA